MSENQPFSREDMQATHDQVRKTRLEDERDGARYALDTGLFGPGLPANCFALVAEPTEP